MLDAAAGTYYVANNGSNGNPGTFEQPWLTINYATSTSSGIGAGDTIMVRAGNYPEAVFPLESGLPGSPIVLMNFPGESVTLDPGRIHFDDGIDYWNIHGLVFLNSSADGLRVIGSHPLGTLKVTHCTFSHHYFNGIDLAGPDFGGVSVHDCVIEWNGEQGGGVPSGVEGTGIVLYDGVGVLWAHRNVISNNWCKGISHATSVDWQADSSVIDSNIIINNFESGIDWLGDDSFITHNYISYNGVRDPEAGEWGDKGLAVTTLASGNLVAFNVIKSNGQMELNAGGPDNKYYHNTIIKDHYYTTVLGSPYAAAIIIFDNAGGNNEFRNNVIVNLLSEYQHNFAVIAEEVEDYASQVWSNNLYWCPNSTAPDSSYKPFKLYGFPGLYATLEEIQNLLPDQENGSLYDNPDWIAYPDSNFTLMETSPAIDAGIDVSFPYSGYAPDLGAYECSDAALPPWLEPPPGN
jgi:hypothetical protein